MPLMTERESSQAMYARPNAPEGNLICYEHVHDSHVRVPTHSHGLLQIVYVFKGVGHFIANDEQVPVEPGSVIINPPYAPHAVVTEPSDPLHTFVITVCPSILALPRQVLKTLTTTPFAMKLGEDPDKIVRSLIRRIQQEQRAAAAHFQTAMRLLVDQLLLSVYRWKSVGDPWLVPDTTSQDEVEWIIEYLNTHYDKSVNLTHLSERTGVTSRHMRTLFKKATGTTMVRYLNRVRIEKAKELLRTTDLPVTEICYKVGYNNLSYFYRMFNDHVKAPPNAFRADGQVTLPGPTRVDAPALMRAFHNSDFHDNFTSGMDGWRTFHPFGANATTVRIDPGIAYSGSQSLYCESPSTQYITAAHRDFPISGPSTYRFRATVMVDDLQNGDQVPQLSHGPYALQELALETGLKQPSCFYTSNGPREMGESRSPVRHCPRRRSDSA